MATHPIYNLPADVLRIICALLDVKSTIRFIQINPHFYRRCRHETLLLAYCLPNQYSWQETLQWVSAFDLLRFIETNKKSTVIALHNNAHLPQIYSLGSAKFNPFQPTSFAALLRLYFRQRDLFFILSGSAIINPAIDKVYPVTLSKRKTFRQEANLFRLENMVNRCLFIIYVVLIPLLYIGSLVCALYFPHTFPIGVFRARFPIGSVLLLSLWLFLFNLVYNFIYRATGYVLPKYIYTIDVCALILTVSVSIRATLADVFSSSLSTCFFCVYSVFLLIAWKKWKNSSVDAYTTRKVFGYLLIFGLVVFLWRVIPPTIGAFLAYKYIDPRLAELAEYGYRVKY